MYNSLGSSVLTVHGSSIGPNNIHSTFSQRSESKRSGSKTPNMLQSFLLGQSPLISVPGTSLPRLSIFDTAGNNTPLTRAPYLPDSCEKEDDAMTKLKTLLEESFMQQSLGLPQKTHDVDRPPSVERCLQPVERFLVEGKTMQLQVRASTSPLSKKKLERIVFTE